MVVLISILMVLLLNLLHTIFNTLFVLHTNKSILSHYYEGAELVLLPPVTIIMKEQLITWSLKRVVPVARASCTRITGTRITMYCGGLGTEGVLKDHLKVVLSKGPEWRVRMLQCK